MPEVCHIVSDPETEAVATPVSSDVAVHITRPAINNIVLQRDFSFVDKNHIAHDGRDTRTVLFYLQYVGPHIRGVQSPISTQAPHSKAKGKGKAIPVTGRGHP
jgi:hypothetical protein